MHFGEKLQKIRKEKNMSQEQLAEQLNVSRQAISKWESGAIPDINNVINISEFFNCSLDYLLLNKEVEEKNIEKEEKTEERTQETVNKEIIILQKETQKRKRVSWDLKWLLACLVPFGILLLIWTLAFYSDTRLYIRDMATGMLLGKFRTYILEHNLYFYIYGSIVCLYVFVSIKCLYPVVTGEKKHKKYILSKVLIWLAYLAGVFLVHTSLLHLADIPALVSGVMLSAVVYFVLIFFLEKKVIKYEK